MGSFENFQKRLETGGGSVRNAAIQSTKELLNYTFSDDPSFRGDVTFWGKNEILPIRLYGCSIKSGGASQQSFQTPLNFPIAIGDLIDLKSDGVWMCTEVSNAYQTGYCGKIQYCNYLLNFIMGEQIKKYPVIVKNPGQSSSGEEVKSQIVLGNSHLVIYIKYDSDTIQLDHGSRFLIDNNMENPTSYRITQVDSVSNIYKDRGYLVWAVIEDEGSERDNLELMIADYYKPQNDMEESGWY